MKLYFAGAFTGYKVDKLQSLGMRNKLYSFHHEKNLAREWGKGLLLDSGAYTASTKGVVIDMDELNEFILEVKPDHSIQLDVIGDSKGTWENYKKQSKVVEVLPVIHSNYTKSEIARVLESSDYICLGAINYLPVVKVIEWLDYMFSFPQIRGKKIHLLGIMSRRILTRYPVYSADSSSALSAIRYPAGTQIGKYNQRTKHYTTFYEEPIKEQLEYEQTLTELWQKKGITF